MYCIMNSIFLPAQDIVYSHNFASSEIEFPELDVHKHNIGSIWNVYFLDEHQYKTIKGKEISSDLKKTLINLDVINEWSSYSEIDCEISQNKRAFIENRSKDVEITYLFKNTNDALFDTYYFLAEEVTNDKDVCKTIYRVNVKESKLTSVIKFGSFAIIDGETLLEYTCYKNDKYVLMSFSFDSCGYLDFGFPTNTDLYSYKLDDNGHVIESRLLVNQNQSLVSKENYEVTE